MALVADSGETRAAVPVAKHELRCDATFPCHDEIRRRTDFWIQVYNTWTTAQGVFHDSLYPERVYSVIDVPDGCRGSSSVVERERNRIKAHIADIADRLQRGARISAPEDQAILQVFPDRTPASLRDAADRVRCQQGNRDRFEAALKRYGAYSPIVRKLIVDAGLPEDIHYLPFVESLYNPAAYSRVGAAGLWQIMPKTARYLGLEIDATVDERLDVEAATIGAARYLKDSRNRLTAVAREKNPSVRPGELSPFVITSYNYGVNGMRRALQQIGPDFITVLNEYKSPSFQVAVKNFYASFLAARYVARNAERYFGSIQADPVLRYHTLVLEHDTSMKRIHDVFGLSEDELRPLNRALTRFVWHGWRFAPQGYRLRLPYRSHGWRQQIAHLSSLGPEDDSRGPVRYTVRKGDTACGIARAFHVQCKDLIDMNRLGSRAFIRIGQVLVIPGKLGSGPSAPAIAAGPGGTYRVRPGDSPCGIATRAGVDCGAFLAMNGLNRASVIHPGQSLRLPGGDGPRDEPVDSGSAPAVASTKPLSYTVKPRDTACEVAERFEVPCAELMSLNGLDSRSILRVGQVLRLSGAGSPAPRASSADAGEVIEASYRVQPGDTPCQIAALHDMNCGEFQRLNNLKPHSVIYVGQALKVRQSKQVASSGEDTPSESAPRSARPVEEVVQDTAGESAASPLDGDIELEIGSRAGAGGLQHYILVESDETLGHYADWLGVGSVNPIKVLNGIGNDHWLQIGRELLLPVKTDEQMKRFNLKRIEYHRVLVEEFKENYLVRTVEPYTVRAGDSPWRIADRFQLPMWVLTRYNPELRTRTPLAGEVLKIPQIESRG